MPAVVSHVGKWMFQSVWKYFKWVCVFLIISLIVWIWQKNFRQKSKTSSLMYWSEDKYKNIHQMCQSISSAEKIFVSIPSYRDPELLDTVLDCLSKAACPYRIFVGVCQQNEPSDLDLEKVLYNAMHRINMDPKLLDHVRVLSMKADDAKGPMYARAQIEQELYENERFVFMIDSHTWFAPDWDIHLIEQLGKCNSTRPILTCYPPNYHKRNKENESHELSDNPQVRQDRQAEHEHSLYSQTSEATAMTDPKHQPTYLRLKTFHVLNGFPEIEGPHFRAAMSTPCPALFWGACMSFTYGQVHRQVPMDPNCPYVFIGEEIAMAARFFTHGFDLFHPTLTVIKHRWKRNRPTFWEQFRGSSAKHMQRQQQEKNGYQRLKLLFRIVAPRKEDPTLGVYDLGKKRDLSDYELWCGVNFLLQFAKPHAWMGVSLQPSEEELIAKFDSLASYQKQRRQYTKKE